jgi:galactonate dehydratase
VAGQGGGAPTGANTSPSRVSPAGARSRRPGSPNRAVAGIIRQLNGLLVGEGPSQIERLWHKTFRSFTSTGSRGAATNVISGIDIALWDIRGKALGQPIYDLLGGKVRDDILLYTQPDSRNFGTDEGVEKEIRAIVDSGHTALKFDPFPHENRIGAAKPGLGIEMNIEFLQRNVGDGFGG